MNILTPFTVEEAVSRGHDCFEVLINEWGLRPYDQYPQPITGGVQGGQITAPLILPNTLTGISIGPRSTVDRVNMAWNTQQVYSGGNSPAFMYRALTNEAPLMFAQPAGTSSELLIGRDNVMTTAMRAGLLFFKPWPFILADGTNGIDAV